MRVIREKDDRRSVYHNDVTARIAPSCHCREGNMMLRGGCSGCGSTLNRKAAGSKKNTHLDPAPLGAGARSTVRIGLSFCLSSLERSSAVRRLKNWLGRCLPVRYHTALTSASLLRSLELSSLPLVLVLTAIVASLNNTYRATLNATTQRTGKQ